MRCGETSPPPAPGKTGICQAFLACTEKVPPFLRNGDVKGEKTPFKEPEVVFAPTEMGLGASRSCPALGLPALES